MKRMFAKLGLRSLVTVVFVFGALFFAANSARAQSPTDNVLVTPQNLVGSAEAIGILKTQVDNIHIVLPGLNGDALKKETMRVQYYKTLMVNVNEGMAVATALTESLSGAVIEDPQKASVDPNVTKFVNEIYVDAVNLLSI